MLFETKDFTIDAEQKEGCQLTLKIKANKEIVQKSYKKAVKNINKEISIPGFRKGKVPEDTVIKRFGSQIDTEWKEILLNTALQEAFQATKIYPLTKESIGRPKIEKCDLEEGAVLILSYEAYPVVPPVDFSKIVLPVETVRKVTDEEIQDVLEEIQETRATWEPITDRPIEMGDYVDLSIDALEEGGPKPIAVKRRFHVKEKRMGQWMQDLLVGKSVNDVVEGESRLDDNATKEARAKFQKTKVKITIHAIYKALLSEINDEFAMKAGAKDLNDLKEKITNDLLYESQEELDDKRFEQFKDQLLKTYQFDLPATLVDSEKNERLERRLALLKKENVSEKDLKQKEKELESEMLEEGKRALRLYFITRQMAKQGNITVTNEEVNRALQSSIGVAKEIPKDVFNRVSNALFERKLKKYALSQIQNS